jgi:hypothetical protein
MPWVDLEQGASLHWCKDVRCSSQNIVANT